MNEDINSLIEKSKDGFFGLNVNQKVINSALGFLEEWLTKPEFKEYVPQIEHLISCQHWDYLLDSFYQVIPFGTGGRRGEVGIGPNRINPWTIKTSAQGHSQYLLKKYGDDASSRGVVFAYDVRQFLGNKYLNDEIKNPLKKLTSRDLAHLSAEVYAGNGIKVYLFDDVRTTPELSFCIRHLHAIAGDMFSASHNPPDHNGKKVYDQFGGQLIPPEDEELVDEVTKNVEKILSVPYGEAVKKGLISIIDTSVDEQYIKAATSVSLSTARGVKIVYTPLHGCGGTSVYVALKKLGFDCFEDPKTSNASGAFENITFNIPNPEVVQSFDTTLKFADAEGADIILSSDPDADRIGIMVKHHDSWEFVNGNEIAAIITNYVIQKRKPKFTGSEAVIKTTVTTDLVKKICDENNVRLIGDLLIGFKYVGDEMNRLQQSGEMNGFLLGIEESHGYIGGNYARDKDAVPAAIWLSELAAELQQNGKTIIDYLEQIHSQYGYFRNYLTEVRLLGATGKEKIDRILANLRQNSPRGFGAFKVSKFEDCLQRIPIVSETDRSAKNVLIFHLEPINNVQSIKVTIRPSGTEPKVKMYFEIGSAPVVKNKLTDVKKTTENMLNDLEKAVMLACYKIIGVDFPNRGFLLFWQLPLDIKMQYFEIESKIEQLQEIADHKTRQAEFEKLVAFLGSNPVQKMDSAFKAKYQQSVLDYLDLKGFDE